MTAGRRILVSFGCLVAGALTMPLISTILLAVRAFHNSAYPSGSVLEWLEHTLWILPLDLLFALPAWVLLLPLVVGLEDAEGRRGWIIGIVGVLFGPAMIALWQLAVSQDYFNNQGDWVAVAMAASVSIPTTAYYLLILKRSTQRSRRVLLLRDNEL
jgi:hypothetical protein